MSYVRMFGALAGAATTALGPISAWAQEATTAFVNVSVIPMDREQVLRDQTVVVQGDRIVAMGPTKQVPVPATAVRIDGRGKFLMPGLADMHAHIPFSMSARGDTSAAGKLRGRRALFLYLANGVTTLRVMGYSGTSGLDLRAEVARGTILGPRMYIGVGPADELPQWHADSAVQFVEAVKRDGYDFIKVHGSANAELVTAARRVGLPVAGHPPAKYANPDGIQWAIQSHLASVEHQIGLMTVADAKRYAAGLKQAGVWVCPTLVHHHNFRHARARLFDDPRWPELRYYPTKSGEPTAEQQATMREEQQAIKVLHDAGVGLLLGTDDVVGGAPGFAVHRELEALVATGLTPYEALLTGTRNVAAYFGTLDSTGTVAVGKRADLVLLAGNPLENVRYTAPPAGVMYGGRWLPQALLDSILKLLEGFTSFGS